MKASKEACREAMWRFLSVLSGDRSDLNIIFVREFLEAAEKKLPKEESFVKDMLRAAGRKG